MRRIGLLPLLLLTLLGAFLALGLPALARGGWTSGGFMTTPREEATATLLRDGRVLVAGGLIGQVFQSTPSAAVEIYDPVANSWSPAPDLGTARYAAQAARLPSGKVLVAGGFGCDPAQPDFCARISLTSAELYDPVTNAWSRAADMRFARAAFTATRLQNGTVLVAGGWNYRGSESDGTVWVAGAEVYHPRTDTWTAAGSLGTPRAYHTSTLLPNGKVLVAGGWNNRVSPFVLASAELYDPASNSWSATASMAQGRLGASASILPDGRVLVGGGATAVGNEGTVLTSAEIYDPAANTWSAAASMRQGRAWGTAMLIPGGEVLVAGGSDVPGGSPAEPLGEGISDSELYDPASNSWVTEASLPQGEELQTATLLVDGRVLVAGGGTTDQAHGTRTLFGDGELFTPRAPAATVTGGPMNEPRDGHVAVRLDDGRVLIVGGGTPSGPYSSTTELYDPATNTWTGRAPMHEERSDFAAVRLPDGRVLAIGGFGGTETPPNIGVLASAEIYDPSSDTWTRVAPMATPRQDFTATALGNGKVLVAGGAGSDGNPIASAELHDPATNSWSQAGTLATARYFHTAVRLRTGKLLVLGGRSDLNVGLASAELYDPAANSWTQAAPMNAVRLGPTATVLASGKVLVAGGWVNDSRGTLASAELYDPDANAWSDAGTMSEARLYHAAVLLPGDNVLVLGGANGNGDVFASADLYITTQNRWYPAPALASPRASATATRLTDGRVLVAGGHSPTDRLASSELYPVLGQVAITDVYRPKAIAATRGWGVLWHDSNGTHTVTDSANLGEAGGIAAPLFDSGPLTPGSTFTEGFPAAGTYPYHSTAGEPTPLAAKVQVPLSVRLTSDGYTRGLLVTWSEADLSGYAYNVQERFEAPGSSFGPWTIWRAPDGSHDWRYRDSVFAALPDGTYQFRARLTNVDTGLHSGWSPAAERTLP